MESTNDTNLKGSNVSPLDAHVFYVDNRTANAGGIMVLDA